MRPRQARYQAALRPDNECFIHSKALPNFAPNPTRHFWLHCAKTVPNTFAESWLCQNPAASHWLGGSFSPGPLASSAISSANTSCIGGAQVIDPEVGNSCAFQCLPPCSEPWSQNFPCRFRFPDAFPNHFFGGKLFIVFCMNLSTFSLRLFRNLRGSRIFCDAIACQRLFFVVASVTVICNFAKL